MKYFQEKIVTTLKFFTGSRSITQSDLEGNYSLGAVVGVGVGCIIVTIILVLLSQYAFLHLRKYKGGMLHARSHLVYT